MEEGSHAHAHRPHATGSRWLDRTMERLVAANSYPNVNIELGNRFDCPVSAVPYTGG